MKKQIDWGEAVKPLLKKYKGKKHPLDYKSPYQLIVMVILSAQTTDELINGIAPDLFKAYPTMESMAKATPAKLIPHISKVRNNRNKANWIIDLAKTIKTEANIPTKLEELVALKGLGRKSSNVIMREMKVPAEGVIVDLHVLRVAERLGITKSDQPVKVEQDIMNAVPQKDWGDIGMAISFLGRQTCRPSHPKHEECVMQDVCAYFQSKL